MGRVRILRNNTTHVCHARVQVDGGQTFTEPTAIIAGKVEGRENVSIPCVVHVLCCFVHYLHAIDDTPSPSLFILPFSGACSSARRLLHFRWALVHQAPAASVAELMEDMLCQLPSAFA